MRSALLLISSTLLNIFKLFGSSMLAILKPYLANIVLGSLFPLYEEDKKRVSGVEYAPPLNTLLLDTSVSVHSQTLPFKSYIPYGEDIPFVPTVVILPSKEFQSAQLLKFAVLLVKTCGAP